ncbi:hypothetical protein AZ268_gp04 [Acidianus rod-shaped virus 2]|uniref:Uncharacterized protein n=1 Tax=Acidianus rod-shaped virus 2 TaxID=1732175 RepID=A0A0N9PCS3_9VIRU|nr:hypothetical protein AZ268_gp04 [Acidianus rod-shaped virus 2]ALG96872.1 hypothetical protein [Acidianus rod-shaped virus 2]
MIPYEFIIVRFKYLRLQVYIGEMGMENQNKISDFKSCLKFFNIPDMPFEALSYSEKELYNICYRFYKAGDLDFDSVDTSALDAENKRKLSELVSQILDTF